MARTKSTKSVLSAKLKDVAVKDLLGLKGYGTEPQPDEVEKYRSRDTFVGKSLNWYNYFLGAKEAKQFIVDYLVNKGEKDKAKRFSKIGDGKIYPTYGWLARLHTRGFQLTETEVTAINDNIDIMLAKADQPSVSSTSVEEVSDEVKQEQQEATKRNIQTVMRERATDVAGEILGLLDDFVAENCKGDISAINNKVVTLLSEKNILPQHLSIVTEPWTAITKEFQEVQTGKDDQLNEAYGYLTKTQVKNILKLIEQITTSINSYGTLKQTTKTVRKRKPVPVAKIVAKLKYMRKFKDEKNKLDLVSVDPEVLHQSAEAWIYDTAKRKLYHYVADSMTKMLIVKGNTLLGFDTKESEAKILRKPAEQLKSIMGSKPAARKFFADIKAVPTVPNGRFNANMIILRAF